MIVAADYFAARRNHWLFVCNIPLGKEASMAKEIPIGARAEAQETVEFKHTLTAHHPELPPVYPTPDMIRLMETAAFHALQPCCEGDEITVGTSINVEHRAASGVGAKV